VVGDPHCCLSSRVRYDAACHTIMDQNLIMGLCTNVTVYSNLATQCIEEATVYVRYNPFPGNVRFHNTCRKCADSYIRKSIYYSTVSREEYESETVLSE
jgi:hypothetical protein